MSVGPNYHPEKVERVGRMQRMTEASGQLESCPQLHRSSKGADMIPSDLKFHTEHEWVRLNGKRATVGISDFAQDALGDIVFVDLPKVGTAVKVGQQIGEVESTKTTSTIYTPVSGTVIEINHDLKDHPEVMNSDPYGKGWIAVIDLADPGGVDQLMTAQQYEAFLASQKKG
jgi:glycine cleavage system H protein